MPPIWYDTDVKLFEIQRAWMIDNTCYFWYSHVQYPTFAYLLFPIISVLCSFFSSVLVWSIVPFSVSKWSSIEMYFQRMWMTFMYTYVSSINEIFWNVYMYKWILSLSFPMLKVLDSCQLPDSDAAEKVRRPIVHNSKSNFSSHKSCLPNHIIPRIWRCEIEFLHPVRY